MRAVAVVVVVAWRGVAWHGLSVYMSFLPVHCVLFLGWRCILRGMLDCAFLVACRLCLSDLSRFFLSFLSLSFLLFYADT